MEEEKKKERFDHGLSSPKAQYYNHMKRMEEAFLEGTLEPSGKAEAPAAPEPSVQEVTPTPVAISSPAIEEDTVIKFVPKKLPIEFGFTIEGEKQLKVKVIALQVSETDEAITVLLDKSVEFSFPVLMPFFLTMTDGQIHKVCYAGGTCQIGPCKFVSFIKTT